VAAGRHLLLECVQGLLAGDGPGAVTGVPAGAGVDIHRLAPGTVQPVLEEPVRRCRPHLLTTAPLRLASFLLGDPPVDEFQLPRGLLLDDAPGETRTRPMSARRVTPLLDTVPGDVDAAA
jgi:hypothetical protein